MSKTQTKAGQLGLEFLKAYFKQSGAAVEVELIAPTKKSQNAAEPTSAEPREYMYNLSGDVHILRVNPNLRASLNRLTTIAMNQGKRHRSVCQLDIEGELAARRALLEVIAADAAAVAEHTHKRAVIEGLSTGERRLIHHHVNEYDQCETLSEGEDEFRYLMVGLKA